MSHSQQFSDRLFEKCIVPTFQCRFFSVPTYQAAAVAAAAAMAYVSSPVHPFSSVLCLAFLMELFRNLLTKSSM